MRRILLALVCGLVPSWLPFSPSVAVHAATPETGSSGFLLAWGKEGSEDGEFDFPIGIAVDRDGDVLVTDFYNARVQRFHPDGRFVSGFAVLPNPGGFALDGEGRLYITHFTAMKQEEAKKPDRLTVYSREGTLLRQWGKTGKGEGEFDYPGGVAVGRDGRVYVADQTNRRVQVFDAEGKFLLQWGEYGMKEGQFGGNVSPKSRVGGPQFVALDGDGNVYTTEGSVGRVQVFTADGRFLHAWGTNDDEEGKFGGIFRNAKTGLRGPTGICVDEAGHVWVISLGGRIQQFTKDGRFLRRVGAGQGSGSGQFLAPHGVAVDGRGHLYVADSFNHRVQKFAIGP